MQGVRNIFSAGNRRQADGGSVGADRIRVQQDANVLQCVAGAANEKITAQRACEPDASARLYFIIKTLETLEVQVVPVQIHAQLQFAAEEPRLDEFRFVILPLKTELDAQPEFLAATGEIRRMKQIKVALADFRKTHHGIHRAESGAHRQIARVFFLHANDEVFIALDFSGLGPRVHFLEILQALQALLARVHRTMSKTSPGATASSRRMTRSLVFV